MNIVQITPGAGSMYCGNCFRDNALVAALRKLGHEALLVPLYLPLTLEEEDQSAGTPLFFSGINVFLEQQSVLFRNAPAWLHRLFESRMLLRWAAGRAAKTRAADVGELTVSMLRGEEGNQARELAQLVAWLRSQPKPDVICLSNALLIGLARRLKSDVGATMVCMLQGEDTFLDALPEPHRAAAWQTLAERAADADLFVSPSRYFAELMRRRLKLAPERAAVVPNGIALDDFAGTRNPEPGTRNSELRNRPAVLGFLARMCPEKGLDTLVEAFLLLKQRGRVKNLRLRVGGGCGPADQPFVAGLRVKLSEAGVLGDVEFRPNLGRAEKLEFLRSLSVFSVPARYGETFGLYVIEALAAGVPVVQPRAASFPELIAATGGGVLCEPGNVASLADAIEPLLLDRSAARALGTTGQQAVREKFSAERMARNMVDAFRQALRG